MRNECDALKRLLLFLQKQKFNGSFEIIVIDNESNDDSAKIALSNGARVFSLPRNLFTYGRAINVGVSRCQADLILLLSAHVWPQEDNFLQSVVDDIYGRPSIKAMYFRQIQYQIIGEAEKSRFAIFPKKSCIIDKDFVCHQVRNGLSLYKASYFSNSACILRREEVQQNPLRDLPYAEENAFALDLIVKGESVAYNNSATVFYEGPISFRRLYEQERRRTIAEKLLEKNYGAGFGITGINFRLYFSSIVNILFIPVTLLQITYRFIFKHQYKWRSRALVYDVYSIGAIWGRLIGVLNWQKFEKTFASDATKLKEANERTKELLHN